MSVPTTFLTMRLLALSLAITVAVELGCAAAFFGMRGRRDIETVILAQVATNPLVELLAIWVGWFAATPIASLAWLVVLAAEVTAFVVEALLYRLSGTFGRPWLASAVLNALSFVVGLVITMAL